MEHTDTKAAGVKGGDYVIRVIQTEQGKPDVPLWQSLHTA
jgi:hypothetical protein